MSQEAQTLTVVIPLRVKSRGGRKAMVTPGVLTLERRQDITLIKAVARAFRWRRMLESGRFATINELAAVEKINSYYVSRVLRLTLLAPDIVEAILDGRQPEGMTLPGLMEPFPVEWLGQRRAFDPNQGSFPDAAQRPFAREFSQRPSRGPRDRPEVEARASFREEQRATTRLPTPFSQRRRAQRGLAAPDMGASWVAPRRSRAG
jgi:hypothetical protein